MVTNRELHLDDYVAIVQRHWGLLLLTALLGPILGFLVSFGLPSRYTSRSVLLVEGQIVPAGYVKPLITDYVSDRMITLEQQVLSRDRLRPLVEKLGLAQRGKSVDSTIDEIRNHVSITPTNPSAPLTGTGKTADYYTVRRKSTGESDDVPAFLVTFTADNARDAQQVCAEVTSQLLAENSQARVQVAKTTNDLLSRELDQAKRNLDEQDDRLAEFKKQHFGQLPTDVDNNLKILTGLTSELDAATQALERAQQDKSFEQALLAQQTAAWKFSQTSPNVPSLREQLLALQNQLVTLRVRYTDDHPDVVKTKKDIAQLQAKIDQMNKEVDEKAAPESVETKTEPPEILQLRQQIHDNEDIIAKDTIEQKRLQHQIEIYQGRLALSPEVEQQYKELTRDNETAQKIYSDLLSNKSQAEMQTEVERRQEGEQMSLLIPANLPLSPSFPVRRMFALYGLGSGLALGCCFVLWRELRDKSIRSEGDVHAGLELPMLAAVPWAGTAPVAHSRFVSVVGKGKPA
jgi:uncharacterized protein involved in exopolysaccharide biosynthesis